MTPKRNPRAPTLSEAAANEASPWVVKKWWQLASTRNTRCTANSRSRPRLESQRSCQWTAASSTPSISLVRALTSWSSSTTIGSLAMRRLGQRTTDWCIVHSAKTGSTWWSKQPGQNFRGQTKFEYNSSASSWTQTTPSPMTISRTSSM